MKKIQFTLLFAILLWSCSKDKKEYISTVIGNWKATEWSNDIGCGCTPFSAIPNSNHYYFNFKANNDFEGNYIFNVPNYNKYLIKDSVHLLFYKENSLDSLRVWYSFLNNNETLQIAFPCIEGCRVRMVRQ